MTNPTELHEVAFDSEDMARIARLAEAQGLTGCDVIRKALALHELLAANARNGAHVMIRQRNGSTTYIDPLGC